MMNHDEKSTMPTLSQTIKNIIKPSWIFRKVVMIYADRKLFMLASLHAVISSVIFVHFALKKFQSQTEKVPEGAPFYSWKVGVPTFEFGTMHAILFQLAVIPLTMCRFLIANLWKTSIGRYVPFNEMTKYHIAIGYTFMFLLFGTVVVFLMFFGVLCDSGAQDFCDKFKSEIIITGYVIFVAFITVGVTSFLRFRIPYRVFYVVHHLVFAAYILTILHTIDVVQRKQGGRSQSFKWFSASLLLYASDRATMYLNNRYFSTIESSNAVNDDSEEEKMLIIKAKRPDLLHFYPGQYVYLKVPYLDNRWHPFSIGSAPESDTLDFYIKVFDKESWSGRLFALMKENNASLRDVSLWEDHVDLSGRMNIEILGPYGVGLGEKMRYSRALIIGTGTGLVPCLSLLREHINCCTTIDTKGRDKDALTSNAVIDRLASQRPMHRLSLTGSAEIPLDTSIHLQMTEMMKIVANANMAKRNIILNTFSLLGPMLGVLMLGLTLSWNQLPFDLYDGMETALIVGTISFQCSFLLLSSLKVYLGGRGFRDVWMYVDFIVVAISVVADWFWFYRDMWGANMPDAQLVYYSLLASYMVFRFIVHIAGSSDNTVEELNKRKKSLVVFDKIKFVWISRSALSIEQIYPDIAESWDELVNAWGWKKARESCEIVIHCTDRSQAARRHLLNSVEMTNLYKEGAVRFGRPSIEALLDKNTEECLEYSAANNDVSTSTLFAFCGSGRLGKIAKEAKIFNDMFLSMTGNTQHVVDLLIQSDGGLVRAEQEDEPEPEPIPESEQEPVMDRDAAFQDMNKSLDLKDEDTDSDPIASNKSDINAPVTEMGDTDTDDLASAKNFTGDDTETGVWTGGADQDHNEPSVKTADDAKSRTSFMPFF